MPRPTDTNTTLSLSASTLGDLYPQTLSGGEALNELGSLTLGGYSAWISALEKLLGHQFLASDVYFIDYLPSQLMLDDVVLVCGAALVLSFFATLYPAWRAARTQPAEALRYE